MHIIDSIKERCKQCYACIRECPANAIVIEDQHAKIIESRCVGCGSCLKVCSPKAIVYRSSVAQVKELLASSEKVVALVDPAISAEFVDITDYRHFVNMIKGLGFDYVNENAFGVDLIARKYQDLFHDFKGKYYLTSKCPVVTAYVEKFHPDLVENLAPIENPMIAMANVVRQMYGQEIKTVFIGPCMAARHEAEISSGQGKVDAVLTFIELRQLFAEFGMLESSVGFAEFNEPWGAKGGLFPLRRGMLQSVGINEDLLNGSVIIVDGRDNMIMALDDFEDINFIKQHFDLFYCEGCASGPGMSQKKTKFKKRTQIVDYVRRRITALNKVEWGNHLKKFEHLDLSKKFKKDDQRLPKPTEIQVQKVLKSLGMENESDQTGCGACGYPSCRDFAEAICQGLAKFEMCHTFNISNLNRYVSKLGAANEKLSETQAALRKSELMARKEHQSAKEASEAISAMMQKIHAGMVIVDENLRIMESNRSFIKMLGDDAEIIEETIPGLVGADLKTLISFHKMFSTVIKTGEDIVNRDAYLGKDLINVSVFTIKKNKIVGGILKDMKAPEVRKEEVIERAKKVIRENLETVQQIAFLLGESASKTEKTLSSIINVHTSGQPEE